MSSETPADGDSLEHDLGGIRTAMAATEAFVEPTGVVTPHTLRHSVAFRVIQEEGGRLEDVQLWLRHQNLQTIDQVYAHLVPR